MKHSADTKDHKSITPDRLKELRRDAEKQLSLKPHDKEIAHLVAQDLARGILSLLDLIDRKNEALEPFATAARALDQHADNIIITRDWSSMKRSEELPSHYLTMRDLRRARAAWEG